ncbi:hypothetical protein ANN_24534 [Periplaneta americana]|uniref:Uncharacterized protein n=1 Tax=Periplaneta americana TaxID=6978 RepID=A0ABQ8S3M8_PERAM|nr:hypothetical protein ANN_24534 [Periplaneta americana]
MKLPNCRKMGGHTGATITASFCVKCRYVWPHDMPHVATFVATFATNVAGIIDRIELNGSGHTEQTVRIFFMEYTHEVDETIRKSDAILRPRHHAKRHIRDEEKEGNRHSGTTQQQDNLSEAPRRHSMALCDVTRLWYCLLVLVVGLFLLVTAEIMMLRERRTALSGGDQHVRTVVFLRELCFQPQVNVTRLETLAARYVEGGADDDARSERLPIRVDILPKSEGNNTTMNKSFKAIIKEHLDNLLQNMNSYLPRDTQESIRKKYEWIVDPFPVKSKPAALTASDMRSFINMVLDSHCQASFKSKPLPEFWAELGEDLLILSSKSKFLLLSFGTTYLYKSAFSRDLADLNKEPSSLLSCRSVHFLKASSCMNCENNRQHEVAMPTPEQKIAEQSNGLLLLHYQDESWEQHRGFQRWRIAAILH